MRYAVTSLFTLYAVIFIAIFAMHTQMSATFGLALLRSVLWPVWVAGSWLGTQWLRGTPLPMD